MLPQHGRTASRTQTGTCLKRQPPTTTTQTCRSTLKLWLLTSKSILMMWQSPRPSPHYKSDALSIRPRLPQKTLLFASIDEDGIQTQVCRAQWSSSLNHSATSSQPQQEPICPVASKMQNWHMLKKSIIPSQTAETHGACGKHFRPSLTTTRVTVLWWRHIPLRCTQPLLFTVWNAEWHTCTKTSHTSQRPGTLSVSSRRKEDPI